MLINDSPSFRIILPMSAAIRPSPRCPNRITETLGAICGGCLSFVAAVVFLIATIIGSPACAQTVAATVSVGANPGKVAVNSVTNKIYVCNYGDNTVTVIDGATNATTTVPVGTSPVAIAVNPTTNMIYVVNQQSNNVTVIDGATNATTTVAVGVDPSSIAVNPVTDKIYVGNYAEVTVTVIDGTTNATTTVTVGTIFTINGGQSTDYIAVNTVTNKVYVANFSDNTVAVIDGGTNATSTITVADDPFAIDVNSVTNKVYVACTGLGGLEGNGNVTVIDGATTATTTVTDPNANQPAGVAVNPVANTIYVDNDFSSNMTLIAGDNNTATTLAIAPGAIAVNSVTNTIYVDNDNDSVTVIDGNTNTTTTVAVGSGPSGIAVNTVTNLVYVANSGSNNVTVIRGGASAPTPTPTPTPPPSGGGGGGGGGGSARLINISTRAQVGTGANILIPGFVIGGSGTETLLIRADGPALAGFGVAGALAQPSLSVFDSSGNVVASNTAWGTNTNPAQVSSAAASVGAFALASGSADCALVASLPAGAYTVQVSGVGNSTGVALAEVYEVSFSGTSLVNISTRAQVGTGADIIIPGFVIAGSGSDQLLARGDGPALTGFGVAGALAQPSLSVYDNSGNVIASNTGWGTGPNPAQITSAGAAVGAFALAAGSADSALIVNLSAGAYTMQLSGVNNSTGVALAELYQVP
jgi:YVTN family beta-propeller protein